MVVLSSIYIIVRVLDFMHFKCKDISCFAHWKYMTNADANMHVRGYPDHKIEIRD